MRVNFKAAQRTLRTSQSKLNVVAVNGCCYGRCSQSDRDGYYKYCGQRFWEFVSGDAALYLELVEPLAFKSHERNEEFKIAYYQMVNKFTREFTQNFCNEEGAIEWRRLVDFNSSSALRKKKRR